MLNVPSTVFCLRSLSSSPRAPMFRDVPKKSVETEANFEPRQPKWRQSYSMFISRFGIVLPTHGHGHKHKHNWYSIRSKVIEKKKICCKKNEGTKMNQKQSEAVFMEIIHPFYCFTDTI